MEGLRTCPPDKIVDMPTPETDEGSWRRRNNGRGSAIRRNPRTLPRLPLSPPHQNAPLPMRPRTVRKGGEIQRLKERLVEKLKKLIDRRRRVVNVKRNGKHDATRTIHRKHYDP